MTHITHSTRIGLALACVTMLATFSLVGCKPSAVRPGVTQVDGAYEQWIQADAGTVREAAAAAVRDLGLLSAGRRTLDDGREQVLARTGPGSAVTITIIPDGPQLTKMTVLIEPGYSEGLSTQIIDRTKARVRQYQAAPPPPSDQ